MRYAVHMADEPIPGAQAIERALTILELFDERVAELTVGEVATRLGVHRSTASRLLSVLVRHGLLELDETGGRYRLGLGIVSLAGLVLNRFPVRARAHDVLRELRDSTEETAYLGLLDGDEVVYIDQASSPHVTVNVDWVGYRQSLTASATGFLLLAFQPPETIAKLLTASRAEARSPEPSELELAAIRRRGYLVRTNADEAGVAAPVRDHRGVVIAAISVWGPTHRVDAERLERQLPPALLNAAARASEALGYRAA